MSSKRMIPLPNKFGGGGGCWTAGLVISSISVSDGSEGALTPLALMALTLKRSSCGYWTWEGKRTKEMKEMKAEFPPSPTKSHEVPRSPHSQSLLLQLQKLLHVQPKL